MSTYESLGPITNICLISKPNNVPTGFECIRKAHDDPSREADLMADSLLERKDRYLCVSRIVGNSTRPVVVEDIKVINDREPPPHNYTPIIQTSDTREKGTQKKLICYKMADRHSGMKCIYEIIFLYKSRRPPPNFAVIGDINGLQMCVREGTIPPMRPPPSVPFNIQQLASSIPSSLPYPIGPQFLSKPPQEIKMPHDYGTIMSTKTDDKEVLEGIPFEINPKYLNSLKGSKSANNLNNLENFRILSTNEIEQRFQYNFQVEHRMFQN